MFLNQGKPEIDDFERKKKLLKEKMNSLAKVSQNIFADYLISEHSTYFSILRKKNFNFLAAGG